MGDTDTRRLEVILGSILVQLMKDDSQQEKIVRLRRAGFTNVDIADLLGTTSASVAQAYFEAGKEKKAKRKPAVR